MNSGKVSNTILKRSVLKLIKKSNNEILQGPGVGIDCGVVKGRADCNVAIATSNQFYSVFRVVNNLAATGAKCSAISSSILMPNDFDERQLKVYVRTIQEQCSLLDTEIATGHTQISDAVTKPVINVTGIGYIEYTNYASAKNVKPNQDIIMTKWIGIEGARIICENKQDEILQHYSEAFLKKALGDICEMSVVKEADIALDYGIHAMHDVSDGGIFGALWDMAEAGNVGLEIYFKDILVKQEIIEICELFNLNPYELASSGCLLMTTENGHDLVRKLTEKGIDASVIGRTTYDNDRIIYNQDEKRYLEPPKRDEIYNLFR